MSFVDVVKLVQQYLSTFMSCEIVSYLTTSLPCRLSDLHGALQSIFGKNSNFRFLDES